ncbi:MAG: pilus assembly protein [Rhodospirillales bacterium]|nr:pilus assembly protein [Rhodospirillales bacterium]
MRRAPLRLDRRGTAAIEFAFTMPLVLLALFAVFEVFRLVQAQRAVDLAVTAALRYGAVNSAAGGAADISAVATRTATSLLGSAGAAMTSTVSFSPSYAPGNTLSVSASYAWSPAFLPGQFATVTLTGSGAITVQN